MAVNPNGFVQVNDFGNPRVLTGVATETISGGQFVGVSGPTGLVTSGTSSYATTDIKFIVCDDAENVVGVAMNTTTSGLTLSVATDALILARAAGSVFAGRLIKVDAGEDAVVNLGSKIVPADAQDAGIAGNIFGRAYTAGASGGFVLAHIKL